MKNWSDKTKINASVVASGFVGAIASPGVVFCAERVLPREMTWIKRVVADNVVAPHMEFFTSASSRIMRANDERRKLNPEEAVTDSALQGEDPASARGKALAIADGLVTAILAWGADFAATLVAQKAINRKLGIDTSPVKTTFVDSTVSLAAMAILPTLAAKPSAAVNHTLSSIIQKATGMPKEHADDISVPLVYTALPNVLGAAAALKSAHYYNHR